MHVRLLSVGEREGLCFNVQEHAAERADMTIKLGALCAFDVREFLGFTTTNSCRLIV